MVFVVLENARAKYAARRFYEGKSTSCSKENFVYGAMKRDNTLYYKGAIVLENTRKEETDIEKIGSVIKGRVEAIQKQIS